MGSTPFLPKLWGFMSGQSIKNNLLFPRIRKFGGSGQFRHFDRNVGRNLTEPMEPEFQAFREGEISPCGRNDLT